MLSNNTEPKIGGLVSQGQDSTDIATYDSKFVDMHIVIENVASIDSSAFIFTNPITLYLSLDHAIVFYIK